MRPFVSGGACAPARGDFGSTARWPVRKETHTVVVMRPFPTPSVQSARLELRTFGPEDVDLVLEVMATSEGEALPPGAPADPADLPEWLAEGVHRPQQEGIGIQVMMLDRAQGLIVGAIGVFHLDWEVRSAEIGYGVHSGERNKGYATEALAALARWLLTEVGLQRVWLTAIVENPASIRVAEKAGFTREGTLRRAGLEDDGLHDLALLSLLDSEI